MAVSCLCSSDRKVFLLNTTNVRLMDACPNALGMKVAQNLLRQDYEALGNCVPPNENSYAIRLIYNPHHNKCQINGSTPYFWGRRDDKGPCVDGQPLNLPSAQNRIGCHLATIMPGSSGNIFDEANVTRCNVPQPYVCQLENNQSFPLCTSLKTITTTTTTITEAAAATTTIPNNVTFIAVGSVLGILALALILLLIYLCCKRNKTKRNADKSDEEYENYRK